MMVGLALAASGGSSTLPAVAVHRVSACCPPQGACRARGERGRALAAVDRGRAGGNLEGGEGQRLSKEKAEGEGLGGLGRLEGQCWAAGREVLGREGAAWQPTLHAPLPIFKLPSSRLLRLVTSRLCR